MVVTVREARSHFSEMASSFAGKVRRRELTKSEASQILRLFEVHLQQGLYRRLTLEREDYKTARDWLAQFRVPLRSLDVLHLAVAFRAAMTIVTTDKKLAISANKLGIGMMEIR